MPKSKLRYWGRENFFLRERLYTERGNRRGQYLFVRRVLFEEQTAYQHILVVEAEGWGSVLLLDGIIQLTLADEFIYHEMMVHPAMHWYRAQRGVWPATVLCIGGGDGGILREVARYPVRAMCMREIDERVIYASRTYLPEVSHGAFDDARLCGGVEQCVGDGDAFVRAACKQSVDVLIVDSTDPIGPGARLFSGDFHKHAARILSSGGVYVRQAGSPMLQPEELPEMLRALRPFFPAVDVYFPSVPTYYGGVFAIVVATEDARARPLGIAPRIPQKLRYLTNERLLADRVPPKFLQKALR